MKKELIIKEDSNARIDAYLSENLQDISRMAIKRLIR